MDKLNVAEELNKVRRLLKALEEHEKARNSSLMGKKNALNNALANANKSRRIVDEQGQQPQGQNIPQGLRAQMFNQPGMPAIMPRGGGGVGIGGGCADGRESFRERVAHEVAATFSSASSTTSSATQPDQMPPALMAMLAEMQATFSRFQATPSLQLAPAELHNVLSSTPASSASSSTSGDKRPAPIFDDMHVPKRRNTQTAATNEPMRTVNVDDDGDLEDGQISQREMRREGDEARVKAAIADPALLARLLAALPPQ